MTAQDQNLVTREMSYAEAIRDAMGIALERDKRVILKGQVPEGYYTTPIGKAEIRREGTDLTIVASAIMVHRALDAAKALEAEGISAEVIDLRTIRPLDRETIIASVCKTGKLLCVYEGVRTLGVGAEISALVAESEAFDYLDAPIMRL